MRNCIRFGFYLLVLTCFSWARAGSYDDYFAAIGSDNAVAVDMLLQRGFDPNTANPQGQRGLILALRGSALKVVDVLLAQPSTDINTRTAQDENALMLAALRGFTDVCRKLIALDADVNKPGWTPLHYAATGGHQDIVQLLLDNHAYIDAASPNGSTPLMMAAMYGTAASVKLLLDAGADVDLKNDLGLTALDFARKTQRPDAVELIAAFIRSRHPKGVW
ncbi:MAG: ankyrin repeat domain-containing protein [Rhodoferax sp.]|nr:ankyrin repeat domain-containing protein [Rhodoferax sp.]MDP3654494.1 ankyrin repeat domain-containing protein [Rhodoferax sp.]